MGLRIHSSTTTLAARNALETVGTALQQSYRRLATGLRITGAGDDAAGLAMAERLRARVRSVDQARRNASDAVSLAQIAEGALAEVSAILVRLRELAVQSGNATTTASDQSVLDAEFQGLIDEVDRLALASEFGGIKLLDGSTSSLTFQIGPGPVAGVDTLQVTLVVSLGTSLSLATLDIGTGGDVSLALTQIDAAINTVGQLRGHLGAVQNRLASSMQALQSASENQAAAESRIRDADLAWETALLARHTMVQKAAIAVLAQANAHGEYALRLLE